MLLRFAFERKLPPPYFQIFWPNFFLCFLFFSPISYLALLSPSYGAERNYTNAVAVLMTQATGSDMLVVAGACSPFQRLLHLGASPSALENKSSRKWTETPFTPLQNCCFQTQSATSGGDRLQIGASRYLFIRKGLCTPGLMCQVILLEWTWGLRPGPPGKRSELWPPHTV